MFWVLRLAQAKDCHLSIFRFQCHPFFIHLILKPLQLPPLHHGTPSPYQQCPRVPLLQATYISLYYPPSKQLMRVPLKTSQWHVKIWHTWRLQVETGSGTSRLDAHQDNMSRSSGARVEIWLLPPQRSSYCSYMVAQGSSPYLRVNV